MVEGGGSCGGSGYEGLVGLIVGIYSVGSISSMSVSTRARGAGRCRGHGRGHCGCRGCGRGGGCGRGCPNNRITICGGYPLASYSLWGECSDLLILAQTADEFCPATSDASRDPSPADVAPAADDDGEFQGTIQLTPPRDNNNCGDNRN